MNINEKDRDDSFCRRVIQEKQALDARAHRLSSFIGTSDVFPSLSADEQGRLREQCEIMWEYSEILGKRIAAFPAAKTTAHRSWFSHELKTWSAYFLAAMDGSKMFEVRLDDRGFGVGDEVILREWLPTMGLYTDRSLRRRITYILRLKDFADVKGRGWQIARRLMPNLVILGLEALD